MKPFKEVTVQLLVVVDNQHAAMEVRGQKLGLGMHRLMMYLTPDGTKEARVTPIVGTKPLVTLRNYEDFMYFLTYVGGAN